MIDWADEMIKNMKENGEIKEKEGGKENTIKLDQHDLNTIATMVITQLNNGSNDIDESENNENNSENDNEESEE